MKAFTEADELLCAGCTETIDCHRGEQFHIQDNSPYHDGCCPCVEEDEL